MKTLLMFLAVFIYSAGFVYADFLKLSINKTKIKEKAVVQLRINNVVKPKLYPIILEENNKMFIDCAGWSGKKKMAARAGNPLSAAGFYDWSGWSKSLTHTFSSAPFTPVIDGVVSTR